MASSTEIQLQHIISICDTLDNLLKKSFGPNALSTLLSTDTGKLLVTTCGLPVMRSLHMSHPIAGLLISSVQAHYNHTGDSSKSFILLVSTILKHIEKSYPRDNSGRIKYCRLVHKTNNVIRDRILPDLLQHCARFHLKSDGAFVDTLEKLIKTSLQGSCNTQAVSHFSHILVSLIASMCKNNNHNLKETLLLLIDKFDCIFVTNVGSSQLESRVIDGIVISRDIVRNQQGNINVEAITFILLNCSIETLDSEVAKNAIFSAKTPSNLDKALLWKRFVVQKYLASLNKHGVSLIFTTSHASDMFVHLARQLNMMVVHCVDEDELLWLSMCSRVWIIQEPQDLLDLDICPYYVGFAQKCKRIAVNSKKTLLLKFAKVKAEQPSPAEGDGIDEIPECSKKYSKSTVKNSLSALDLQYQVLVNGSTAGICAQNKSSMYNALKCVYMWLDPDNLIPRSPTIIKSEDSLDDSETKEDHTSQETPLDGSDAGDLSGEAFSICAGGAWELLFYRYCKRFEDKDSGLTHMMHIVGDSLLSVPLRLLQNSYAPSAQKMQLAQLFKLLKTDQLTHCVDQSHSMTSDVLSHGSKVTTGQAMSGKDLHAQFTVYGVDAIHGTQLISTSCGFIEPVASKILLLNNVLDFIYQSLRIESLVSVRRLKEQSDDSDD